MSSRIYYTFGGPEGRRVILDPNDPRGLLCDRTTLGRVAAWAAVRDALGSVGLDVEEDIKLVPRGPAWCPLVEGRVAVPIRQVPAFETAIRAGHAAFQNHGPLRAAINAAINAWCGRQATNS